MKKNRIFNRFAFLALLSMGLLSMLQSCKDSDSDSGMPSVNYIRVTSAEKSDSLVTHAFLGSTIAIMGDNLEDVGEIWFNDQQAVLNTCFITNRSIIVSIPQTIPTVVTDKMMIIKRNKVDTLKLNFGVDVPPPMLNSMLCEYVKDGETAVIRGNYFIDDPNKPIKVIFSGGLEGKLDSISLTELKVKVPVGAGSGPITVKSLYGSTRSSFHFRDERNIILNFDDLTTNSWQKGAQGNSNPDPISGYYERFKGKLAGAAGATWDDTGFSFLLWNAEANRPSPYVSTITNMCIKFECNVDKAWSSCALQMIFTPSSVKNANSYMADASVPRGLWIPWKTTGSFTTNGWITVSIPLSEFKYTHTGTICENKLTVDMLGGLTFFVYNGGINGKDCTPDICIDNIRVVPL